MSTFDRWNKLAGILNESAEPQQTVETEQVQEATVEETQSSTMNESDLRGMIAELAKEILSEGLVDYIKKGDSMGDVFDPATLWSPTKKMQWGLALLGYLDPNSFSDIDGKFGPKTKKALERFQKQSNLKPDGVWGPKTNAAFTAAAKSAIAAGMDANLGTVTDPSPTASLGTVNATKQWLQSWVDYSDLGGKVLRMGGTSKRQKPAAPGENPLNRVLKNLVKRIKAGGENVDEKSVKSAMVDKMKSDPAFATNVRDLSKVANKDQLTHRLMRKISQPVMVALSISGSDTMVASADSEDERGVGASAATPGDPVKYDDDPSSMPTLPGIDPKVFAGGIEHDARDGSGDRILSISRSQWEEEGEPDLDRIAKGAGVDRVELSK